MSESNVISVEEYHALRAELARRRNKYGAEAVRDDEYGWFASTGERDRWYDLLRLRDAGEVRHLRRQVPFDLIVGGVRVARYVADYTYEERADAAGWRGVVEDWKPGVRTEGYRLKRRLMLACLGIAIRETGKG